MEKLDNRTLWSYSVGAVGRDAAYVLISMFLMTYIQYTMKLSVLQYAAISVIMVLALIWDAVNDLLMGMIIENSKMKMGKFKPWILAGSLLNAIVIICLFTVRPEGWLFVVFFALGYVSWGMTYTMNDIAYYGLLPSLSSVPSERNRLITLMNIFVSIGQFTVAVAVPMLVAGNAISAYRNIALAVALAFVLFQLLTAFGVRERPRKDGEKLTLKTMYQMFRGNDQLMYIGIATLFYFIGQGLLIMFGMNFFYFEFGYKEGGAMITMFTVMYGLGTLMSQVFFTFIVERVKRMKLLAFTTISIIVLYAVFLSIGYVLPKDPIIINITGFLIFFFQGLEQLLIIVMINNTVEYDEYKTGQRHDSVISAVRSFAVKLASGINQGIVALVLILSGIFRISQNVSALELKVGLKEITTKQALDMANTYISQVKPDQTLVLRLGIVLFPIVAFILVFTIIRKKYFIDEEKYDEIVNEIRKRA